MQTFISCKKNVSARCEQRATIYYRPKRSFGQGNVFTRVCDSVDRGVVCSNLSGGGGEGGALIFRGGALIFRGGSNFLEGRCALIFRGGSNFLEGGCALIFWRGVL